MSYLTLAWLREGMIVERTVSDSSGRVLVKAGAALTAQDLKLLAAAEVKGLNVQVHTDAIPNVLPQHPGNEPSNADEVEQRLQQRFRHLDPAHPLIKELLRLCRLREMLHLTEPTRYDS